MYKILILKKTRKKKYYRKKRNWTFDSNMLLSLQLNPSYQQTGPSFIRIIYCFILIGIKQYTTRTYITIYFILFIFNQSRAISTTRTVFRLNTNQSHAYENTPIITWEIHLELFIEGPNLLHTPFFGAWRVVSTPLRLNSPWRYYSRLLVIPYSSSRISDYNSYFILF